MTVAPKKLFTPLDLQNQAISNVSLFNKVTITAPASAATLTLADGSSLITAGAFSTTFTASATTALTLPTTGTLATLAGTETFTNKKFNASSCSFSDNSDATKLFKFSASGNGTGRSFILAGAATSTDKTVTFPNITGTVSLLNGTAPFTTVQSFNNGLTTAGLGLTTGAGGLSLGDFVDSTTTGSNVEVVQTGSDYSVREFTNTSLVSIKGIQVSEALLLLYINSTGNPITIINNASVSGAANKIITGYGTDIIIPNGGSIWLVFDTNSQVFRTANSYQIPISTGISGLGTGIATFLATPSSANLAAAITNETGSGALVFATSPTFTTNFLVAGSSSGTTTIQATAAASGTLTLPAATDTLVGKATTDTLTNKTLDNSIVTGDLSIYFGSNIRTQDNTSGKSFSLSAYDLTDTALNPLITLTNGTVASLTIAPTGSSLVNITASNLSISGDSEGLDFSGTGDHLIQSSAGNLLFGTCSILGVTDASNASSGYIGEIISSSVASGSAVSLTTTVVATVTSITLSAGDWEIYGSIAFSGGAVTATQSQGFFGTASGSSSTGRDLAKNTVSAGVGSSVSSDLTMAMPTYRVNITTPTTYYLKANSTFTIGSATTYGTIEARRMR